ncbi:hypothetical protein [Allocoleopsis franciscana]|uniref:hypothetical protein n=1 Tax=Allocoleopsis franciscana TaxID=2886352 RepID=UPI001D030002|nr:hypothetical protein [Allocoleopsis franciscana]
MPKKIDYAIAIYRQNRNARFYRDGAIDTRFPVWLNNLVFTDIDKRILILVASLFYCPRPMFLYHDEFPRYKD